MRSVKFSACLTQCGMRLPKLDMRLLGFVTLVAQTAAQPSYRVPQVAMQSRCCILYLHRRMLPALRSLRGAIAWHVQRLVQPGETGLFQ